MAYYILILLVTFFSQFIDNELTGANRFVYKYSLLALVGLFVCFGYMTGSDWRAYEPMYNWVEESNSSLISLTFIEPGYVLYMKFFHLLGFSFWNFFITTKVLTYLIIINSLNKYSDKRIFFFALTFFIAFYGYFLWIDNPMRNLIAVTIFLMALPTMLKRDFLTFILFTFLAMSFHFSAIIMLFLYWASHKRLNTITIILLYVFINVVFLSKASIYFIVDALFSWIPFVSNKIIAYFIDDGPDSGGKLLSIGFLLHNVFFFLILYSRTRIETLKNGNVIFNLSVLYFIFFRIGLTVTVMGRLQLFLGVFYSIVVAALVFSFEKRLKLPYLLYVLIICMLSSHSYLSKDFRYVPYSNYLWYIFREKPTFEYRDTHNPQNTPYF